MIINTNEDEYIDFHIDFIEWCIGKLHIQKCATG